MREDLLRIAGGLPAARAFDPEVAAGRGAPESCQVVDRELAPAFAHLEEQDLEPEGVGALDGQSLDLDEDLLFSEVLVVQAVIDGSY